MSTRPHPLVREGRVLTVPGVYDVLSARIARDVGFPAAVLTGYAVAATHLGEPDVGILTQSEMLDVARRICNAVDIALVVDGDTGGGGVLNVQRLVRELVAMGAAGVILEDQEWPKRCGHLAGKSVVDAEEHAAKIRAAVAARGPDRLLVTARTDALATDGIGEALERARLYKEAGADVLFVEGPRSREDLALIGRELPGPLAVNLIEGGVTPVLSLEELADLGFFSVGFVLSGLFTAAAALRTVYTAIFARGATTDLPMTDFAAFADLIGTSERLAADAAFSQGAGGAEPGD